MDAADDYQEAMTQTWRKRARAALEALVAEACAPPPERVCRWTINADGAFGACGSSGWGELDVADFTYCPGCGERVEATAWADEDIEEETND